MIFDMENLFSNAQAVTASAASTNVIDLGSVRDIGPGNPIDLTIQLTADAGGTSPTIKAGVQIDTAENFSSAVTVAESAVISGGKAGDQFSLNYVPNGTKGRYVRLYYTTTGSSPTHAVTAGLSMGTQTNR